MTKVQIQMNHVELRGKETSVELQLLVTGHACFGKKGHDIVCAAESVLVQTLAASLAKLDSCMLHDYTIEGVAGSGCMGITVIPTTKGWDYVRGAFELVATGFYLLAQNYPRHVQIKLNNYAAEEDKDCA